MSEKILVPVLGESITEATVSKWLKKEGDSIIADEAIVELETDKVNLEVPSPSNGILTQVTSKDGDVVKVGALLGIISQSDIKISQSDIKKEKTKPDLNNTAENLKINSNNTEKPLILNDEEPLVLTNEVVDSENFTAIQNT